jgi:hypothetical protein
LRQQAGVAVPQRAQAGLVGGRQITIEQADASGGRHAARQQPHSRRRDQALAAAGGADQAQALALVHAQRHVAHQRPPVVADAEPVDAQTCHAAPPGSA